MRLIVTVMKTKGPFILEWAARDLAIGSDRFLIYATDCENGSDAIWRRLAKMRCGAHVETRGVDRRAAARLTPPIAKSRKAGRAARRRALA